MVLSKWFVQEHAFLHRAYDALINCFVITFPNLAFRRLSLEGDSRIRSVVDSAWPSENSPSDAGDLGGQGDRHLVDVHPVLQRVEPTPDRSMVRLRWVKQDLASWPNSFMT